MRRHPAKAGGRPFTAATGARSNLAASLPSGDSPRKRKLNDSQYRDFLLFTEAVSNFRQLDVGWYSGRRSKPLRFPSDRLMELPRGDSPWLRLSEQIPKTCIDSENSRFQIFDSFHGE